MTDRMMRRKSTIYIVEDQNEIVHGVFGRWVKQYNQAVFAEFARLLNPNLGRNGLGSESKRELVFARDGHRCLKCGTTENLSLDHILAQSLGGKSNIENLQTLCQRCNLDKGIGFVDYRK